MVKSPNIFSNNELKLLRALQQHKVDFMLVGLSAAALQGAPVVTQDIDIWVKDLKCSNFLAALSDVGAVFVPSFSFSPPSIAGKGFGLFDLVLHMSGLRDFDSELKYLVFVKVGDQKLPVLSLQRIIKSKKAADRPKDKLVLPVLEDALNTIKAIKG